jgi:hypothetical protein
MAAEDFLLVEHEEAGGARLHCLHRKEPGLIVEWDPVYDRLGRLRGGTLRRVRFGNSVAPVYHQYGKLVRDAERFFKRAIEARLSSE